jgi:trans-aconitate 2-methyltransferase
VGVRVTREWDAGSYDRIAAPMTLRGIELVDELDLRGDEHALDAGCGTGQVTARLLERLPRGRVLALDGSRQMLDRAGERFGDDPRLALLHADLERPLPVDEALDVVVSTSTFHWIADHDALFRHLAAAMRPGAVLAAECGGEGNIASVMAILAELGYETDAWRLNGVSDTRARLAAAGFADARVELVPRPARIPAEQLREYLRTVVLGAHVREHGDGIVEEVAARMDEPVLDHVRLVIRAVRG